MFCTKNVNGLGLDAIAAIKIKKLKNGTFEMRFYMKAGMYVRLFYSVLGEKVERLIFPDAMEVAKFMTGLPLVISYSFDKHFTYKVQQPTYGALHFSLKR